MFGKGKGGSFGRNGAVDLSNAADHAPPVTSPISIDKSSAGVELSGSSPLHRGLIEFAEAQKEEEAQRLLEKSAAAAKVPSASLVTGRQFEGEWRRGAPWAGRGMWRGPRGYVFDGSWAGGRPYTGKGGWVSSEGWLLEGQLAGGRFISGSGKWRDLTPLPATPEEAELPPDDMDRMALMSSPTQEMAEASRVFDGEMRGEQPWVGQGAWSDKHGHVFEAEWQAAVGTGQISQHPGPAGRADSDDLVFVGSWQDCLPFAGDGRWCDALLLMYVGSWRGGKPQSGSGNWATSADKESSNVHSGKWEQGKGSGRIDGPNYEAYHGSWTGGRPLKGRGQWRDERGRLWDGNFAQGRPVSGKGTYCDEEGNEFVGEVLDAEPVLGRGSWYSQARRSVYDGVWDPEQVGAEYGGAEVARSGRGKGTVTAKQRYGTQVTTWIYEGRWSNSVPWQGRGQWRGEFERLLEGEWTEGEGIGYIMSLETVPFVRALVSERGYGDARMFEDALAQLGARAEYFKGTWADGEGQPLTGKGGWMSQDGLRNLYRGEWMDSKGRGRITQTKSGRAFAGQWWDGRPYRGKGVYRSDGGHDLEGEWKGGVRVWQGYVEAIIDMFPSVTATIDVFPSGASSSTAARRWSGACASRASPSRP